MEESAVIMTGLDIEKILQGIQCLKDIENNNEKGLSGTANGAKNTVPLVIDGGVSGMCREVRSLENP